MRTMNVIRVTVLCLMLYSGNALALNYGKKGEPDSGKKIETSLITLKGRVLDHRTGESLAGVSIRINNRQWGYTDLEGCFSISIARCDSIRLNAELIAYHPKEITVRETDKELQISLNQVER